MLSPPSSHGLPILFLRFRLGIILFFIGNQQIFMSFGFGRSNLGSTHSQMSFKQIETLEISSLRMPRQLKLYFLIETCLKHAQSIMFILVYSLEQQRNPIDGISFLANGQDLSDFGLKKHQQGVLEQSEWFPQSKMIMGMYHTQFCLFSMLLKQFDAF